MWLTGQELRKKDVTSPWVSKENPRLGRGVLFPKEMTLERDFKL